MPRFFLDLDGTDPPTRDTSGTEWPSRDVAREDAIRSMTELARMLPLDGTRRDLAMVIRDEADQAIFRATLSLTGAWLD